MNNSQEFNSNQMRREQMLQQIILDQKQRIRELETIDHHPPLRYQQELQLKSLQLQEVKQQLLDCDKQLEEGKQLLVGSEAQREQAVQELKLLQEECELQRQRDALALKSQYEELITKLTNANELLNGELQHAQPLRMALNNYTQEETYIQQITVLQEFLNSYQKQYLSELIHYKRAAEMSRQNSELMSARFHEDKRNLQKQIDDLIRLDQQIQEDVILRLKGLEDSLKWFSGELIKRNGELKQYNNDNYKILEDMCNQQADQVWLKEKSILQANMRETINRYERKLQEHQVSMPTIPDNGAQLWELEKQQLESAIEDMKMLAQTRERVLMKEVQRYQEQVEQQTKQAQSRELHHQNEIAQLKECVQQLEQSYDSRENFVTFNVDTLQDTLDSFRVVTEQIKLAMLDKKGFDTIKECKELIIKLSKQKQKGLSSVNKLEQLCRDFLRNPTKSQMADEIKLLLIDVTRSILNSDEYKQHNVQLLDAISELEGYITVPSRRVDTLLKKFHNELQILTQIRMQIDKKSQQQQQQSQSACQSQQSIENQPGENYLEQIRIIEKEAHKQELNIAIAQSTKLLQLYEQKMHNLKVQNEHYKDWVDKQKYTYDAAMAQSEQELKTIRQQMQQHSKLLNEVQLLRVNERKELLKRIKESEDKLMKAQQTTLKTIESKCQQIEQVVTKKTKLLNPTYQTLQQQQDIQPINEQNELKILQQKDKERDEQMQGQLQQLAKVVDDLRQNINNLHNEKTQLIEQLDAMNNLLQTQKKLYYSFRQPQ